MASATTTTPKAFLPDDFGSLLITTASTMSVALQTTFVASTDASEFRIPKITDEVAVGWYGENQEIALSDPGLNEEVVRPRKVAGLSKLSNELIGDSSPAASQVVGDSIARSIAVAIDQGLFSTEDGTSSPPKGLGAFATGTLTEITGPAEWTNIDPFTEAIYAVETVGARLGVFVANPADAEALAKLKRETGSNEPLLAPDPTSPSTRRISGVELWTSAAVPAGTVYGWDRSRVYTVLRTGTEVELDRSVYFGSYSSAVRAVARVGFGYPQPKAIARITLG